MDIRHEQQHPDFTIKAGMHVIQRKNRVVECPGFIGNRNDGINRVIGLDLGRVITRGEFLGCLWHRGSGPEVCGDAQKGEDDQHATKCE